MSNEGYHEPVHELTGVTREMHRAITSLMEELEAVDWYNQRVNACHNNELKAILSHNRFGRKRTRGNAFRMDSSARPYF